MATVYGENLGRFRCCRIFWCQYQATFRLPVIAKRTFHSQKSPFLESTHSECCISTKRERFLPLGKQK